MKYCPYCGTILVDGAVSFCAECGKALPVSEKKKEVQEKSDESEQEKIPESQQIKPSEPPQSLKQQLESPAVTSSIPEDDYDGYYDDILPADEGRFSEGIDRGLVKKIVLIIGMVLLIVGACVMMMYLL